MTLAVSLELEFKAGQLFSLKLTPVKGVFIHRKIINIY